VSQFEIVVIIENDDDNDFLMQLLLIKILVFCCMESLQCFIVLHSCATFFVILNDYGITNYTATVQRVSQFV